MRWNMMLAAAASLAATAMPTAAQDRDALYMRSLAATCANCHGTQGKAQPGSSVVSLAGTRSATIMHQLAKGYSEAQIAQIAAYFAAQSR